MSQLSGGRHQNTENKEKAPKGSSMGGPTILCIPPQWSRAAQNREYPLLSLPCNLRSRLMFFSAPVRLLSGCGRALDGPSAHCQCHREARRRVAFGHLVLALATRRCDQLRQDAREVLKIIPRPSRDPSTGEIPALHHNPGAPTLPRILVQI
jgi:hypothetical protein